MDHYRTKTHSRQNSEKKKKTQSTIILKTLHKSLLKQVRVIELTLCNTNFKEMVETTCSVELRIHVHKEKRSKKLIECLSDFGLSISCEKVMTIENDFGNAVAENTSLNHVVFVPPNIQ